MPSGFKHGSFSTTLKLSFTSAHYARNEHGRVQLTCQQQKFVRSTNFADRLDGVCVINGPMDRRVLTFDQSVPRCFKCPILYHQSFFMFSLKVQ